MVLAGTLKAADPDNSFLALELVVVDDVDAKSFSQAGHRKKA